MLYTKNYALTNWYLIVDTDDKLRFFIAHFILLVLCQKIKRQEGRRSVSWKKSACLPVFFGMNSVLPSDV